MLKKVIDGKKVIVKGNSQNIPSFKTIKDVYSHIHDNKRIPIVFETKEQYLDEYIKNQEKSKKTSFKPAQIAAYKHSELNNMSNIVSRYTTNHNPFIDRRIVFFNDHKIPLQQFKDSAVHEYGHELWEKNPKIRKDWKSVSNSTSPTPYGRTAKQEDFSESYMLARKGQLEDPKRERIIQKDVGLNRQILPWHGNIEQQSITNPNYRKVIETGSRAQLVLMSLKPKEEIGNEVHPKVDQFFRIEQGRAKFSLANGKINYNEGNGGAVFVPAGTWHNVINPSANKPLKLYTIYSPPNHPVGTIQRDRPAKDKRYYGVMTEEFDKSASLLETDVDHKPRHETAGWTAHALWSETTEGRDKDLDYVKKLGYKLESDIKSKDSQIFSELGGDSTSLIPIQNNPYIPIDKTTARSLVIHPRADPLDIQQSKQAVWNKLTTRQSDVSNQDISAISQTLGDTALKKELWKESKKIKDKKKPRVPLMANIQLPNITSPTQTFTYTNLLGGERTVMIPPRRTLTSPRDRLATQKDLEEGKGYRDYTRRDWVPIDDTKPLPTVKQFVMDPLGSGDMIFKALDFDKTKRAAQDWKNSTKYNVGQTGEWLNRVLTHTPIHTIREDKPESIKMARQPSIPLGYKLFKQFNTQDSRQAVLNDPRQTDQYGNAREGFAHTDIIGTAHQTGGVPRIAQDSTALNSVKDELGGGTGNEGMPYLKFNPPRGEQYPQEIEFAEQFKEYGLPKYFDPRGEVTELGGKVYGSTKDNMFNPGTKERIIDISSNDIKVPSFREAFGALGPKALYTLNPDISVENITHLSNDVSSISSFSKMFREAGTRTVDNTPITKDPTILSKDTIANNRIIKDDDSKDFSLLDAELIEGLAPSQGAIPTEFKWVE